VPYGVGAGVSPPGYSSVGWVHYTTEFYSFRCVIGELHVHRSGATKVGVSVEGIGPVTRAMHRSQTIFDELRKNLGVFTNRTLGAGDTAGLHQIRRL